MSATTEKENTVIVNGNDQVKQNLPEKDPKAVEAEELKNKANEFFKGMFQQLL